MRTADLTDAALDWAVAKCEGKRDNDYGWWWDNFKPSTDWAQGGPIIERERIAANFSLKHQLWFAENYTETKVESGPTPLIAAMRCYVASKLGDDIEIPTELLGEMK